MRSKSALAAGGALGAILALSAGAAQAQDEESYPNVEFGARAFVDYVALDADREVGTDFEDDDVRLRLGRVWLEGDLAPRVAYKAEIDFGLEDVVWQDVFLAFKATDDVTLTVGNIKTLSLENLTSDAVTTFMERGAFADVLGVGRLMSVEAKTGGKTWTAAAAVTGESINDFDPEQSETGVSVRGTFAPIAEARQQVHLGAWARHRERNAPGRFAYRTRNNTNFGPRFVSTGSIGDADDTYALEAAWVGGPFSLQGEWAHVDVDRPVGGAEVRTWYAYGSWFPTGEMRRYRPEQGRFSAPKILKPLGKGGFGAVELALRYDAAELDDVPAGGDYSAWTAGVTWYPHERVRLMANYTDAENNNRAAGADVDVKVWQLRFQVEY